MSALKLPVDALQERIDVTAVISEEQSEILADVLGGLSTAALASKYFLSEPGIQFRINRIFRAFNVKSRVELIALAATEGLHFSVKGFESPKKLVHCVRIRTETREF